MKKTIIFHASMAKQTSVLAVLIDKLDVLVYSKRSYALEFEFQEDDENYATAIGLICSSIYGKIEINHYDNSIVIVSP